MNPFDLPHECEREDLAKRLAKLNRRQRRTLRAYVRQVEFGPMSLAQWLQESEFAPAESTWRRPGSIGGKYWGTEADPCIEFRDALDAYQRAYEGWELADEAKAVRQAQRTLRVAAPAAAQQLVTLSQNAELEEVRRKASESILDRAGVETAEKSVATQHVELAPELRRMIEQVYGDNGDGDAPDTGDDAETESNNAD